MKYEEIISELEKIATKLDSESTTLTDAVSLFENSVKLAKSGFDIINETTGKITVLKKELDSLIEKPLDK